MILEVTICVFESVIISVLPAPSVLDSLVKTPPMVFTVAAALETTVVDAVHSKPCTEPDENVTPELPLNVRPVLLATEIPEDAISDVV